MRPEQHVGDALRGLDVAAGDAALGQRVNEAAARGDDLDGT